jgi:ArsR family transcriptional regulator
MLELTLIDSAIDKCSGNPLASPLQRDEAEEVALLLKAVADPARLQLLSIMRASAGGSACACDLTPAVGLSQPTVSHHLKVLTEAGLVTRERRGNWAWFTVVPERLEQMARIFA